jgi:DNA-binding HxlR family transcriptional regulator
MVALSYHIETTNGCNKKLKVRMPKQTSLAQLNCSLAQTLEAVGDGWSLLILRDLFLGSQRFSELAASLPIARNILTARLQQLQAAGLIERTGTAARPLYHLSDAGFDLIPSLVALMQWGDRWLNQGHQPMRIVDAKGSDVRQIKIRDHSGRPTDPKTLRVLPGPGADPRTRAFIELVSPSG